MRYSIEPKDRIHVKGNGFLSFDENIGKNLSGKYSQKLLDSAKKSTTDTIKTASKGAIQKTAEATGGLIRNETADKIREALSQNCLNTTKSVNTELNKEMPKERYTFPEKRQQSIDELRLIK